MCTLRYEKRGVLSCRRSTGWVWNSPISHNVPIHFLDQYYSDEYFSVSVDHVRFRFYFLSIYKCRYVVQYSTLDSIHQYVYFNLDWIFQLTFMILDICDLPQFPFSTLEKLCSVIVCNAHARYLPIVVFVLDARETVQCINVQMRMRFSSRFSVRVTSIIHDVSYELNMQTTFFMTFRMS